MRRLLSIGKGFLMLIGVLTLLIWASKAYDKLNAPTYDLIVLQEPNRADYTFMVYAPDQGQPLGTTVVCYVPHLEREVSGVITRKLTATPDVIRPAQYGKNKTLSILKVLSIED